MFNYLCQFHLISIHAPTRGATLWNVRSKMCERFQSTLLQEERLLLQSQLLILPYFNPRSYKRSDSRFCLSTNFNNYFNPRSYKRSDR